jgi:hypothetical protein
MGICPILSLISDNPEVLGCDETGFVMGGPFALNL